MKCLYLGFRRDKASAFTRDYSHSTLRSWGANARIDYEYDYENEHDIDYEHEHGFE